jgi:hypothetical protein
VNQSITYTVRRHVEARDDAGKPTKIALAFVKFPGGTMRTLAISEDLIRFAGEGVIEREVSAFAGYEVTRQ